MSAHIGVNVINVKLAEAGSVEGPGAVVADHPLGTIRGLCWLGCGLTKKNTMTIFNIDQSEHNDGTWVGPWVGAWDTPSQMSSAQLPNQSHCWMLG